MINNDDLLVLEQFHADCVRFWQRELGYENDCGREPYLKALEDIKAVKTNPFIPFHSPKIDAATKDYFIRRLEINLGLRKVNE